MYRCTAVSLSVSRVFGAGDGSCVLAALSLHLLGVYPAGIAPFFHLMFLLLDSYLVLHGTLQPETRAVSMQCVPAF